MTCDWKAFLSILPPDMRKEVDKIGQASLQELRLRINAPPELVMQGEIRWLRKDTAESDLLYCINAASRYSPWAAESISRGFLTAPGGHRIGICGEAVHTAGQVSTIKNITSLCIRVARDFPGVSRDLGAEQGSVLIVGAPGWGKTTLLRDLIRQRSNKGEHIALVDERSELFPKGFSTGSCTDILTGCRKPEGISMVLKTMGPQSIALDEITSQEDAQAILDAAGCGVNLLATAHGSSMEDLFTRKVYRRLMDAKVFDTVVLLHRDKSWHRERSTQWITNGQVRC